MAEFGLQDAPSVKRAQSWLAELGCYARPEAIAVLSNCVEKREIQFLVSLLSVPGWYCIGTRAFGHPHYTLTPRVEVAGAAVSFLIESRNSKKSAAVDIESSVNSLSFRSTNDARAEAIRSEGHHYLRLDTTLDFDARMDLRELLKEEFREVSKTYDPRSPWHKPPFIARIQSLRFDWSDLS